MRQRLLGWKEDRPQKLSNRRTGQSVIPAETRRNSTGTSREDKIKTNVFNIIFFTYVLEQQNLNTGI